MLELVSQLPDRQFYYDSVLSSLGDAGDNWDAVQRFHFAPGPATGELIASAFVQMDGVDGLVFAAAKIGALLVVGRLIELESLSPEIREECRLDANDDVRELVADATLPI